MGWNEAQVDTNRREYVLHLELRCSDGELKGSCIALSTNTDDPVRVGNALADYCELTKQLE